LECLESERQHRVANRSHWQPKAIYITENGCAASDQMASDGSVYDEDRVMYLRNSMTQLQRATAEGIPVNRRLRDTIRYGVGRLRRGVGHSGSTIRSTVGPTQARGRLRLCGEHIL
jgi:hypothetical protein